jgi:hypothetical protein
LRTSDSLEERDIARGSDPDIHLRRQDGPI